MTPKWEQANIDVPEHLWIDDQYLGVLAEVFLDEVLLDDRPFIRGLLEKYQEGDPIFRYGVNSALLTITGWTLPTLANKAYENL